MAMGTIGFATSKRPAAAMAGAALALLLSACGSTQDASRFFAEPGKYDVYTCPQIVDQMAAIEAQGRRLEGLMARVGRDASGPIINSIAYEPDYLNNRGELRELQKSAAAKNCPPAPPPVPKSSLIR